MEADAARPTPLPSRRRNALQRPPERPRSSGEYEVRGRRWMDCIVRLGNGRAIGRARVSVFGIRAFVKIREQLATNAAILKRLAEIDKTLLVHDSTLRDLYQKLLPLLSPPPEPAPRRRIGFHQS